jgi:hypothetical protein
MKAAIVVEAGKTPIYGDIWTPPALQELLESWDRSDCRRYIRPLLRPSTPALMTVARRLLMICTVSEHRTPYQVHPATV